MVNTWQSAKPKTDPSTPMIGISRKKLDEVTQGFIALLQTNSPDPRLTNFTGKLLVSVLAMNDANAMYKYRQDIDSNLDKIKDLVDKEAKNVNKNTDSTIAISTATSSISKLCEAISKSKINGALGSDLKKYAEDTRKESMDMKKIEASLNETSNQMINFINQLQSANGKK